MAFFVIAITKAITRTVCKKGIVDEDVFDSCVSKWAIWTESVVTLVVTAIVVAVTCVAAVVIFQLYRRAYANEVSAKPASGMDIAPADNALRRRAVPSAGGTNISVNGNGQTINAASYAACTFSSARPQLSKAGVNAMLAAIDDMKAE